MFSRFLLHQIHSLKMILPRPLLPLFHPPNPLHQTLLAFYGLHSLVSESEWSSSSLFSSEQSFLFTHLPLSQLHTHTFLFILYLLSIFLYLHHHLPFFCSSSLRFLQFHIAQSTSSPFSLSLSFPLMLESSSGATGRPSLCGFNGFMKYTVSMSAETPNFKVLMSSWSPAAAQKQFPPAAFALSILFPFLTFTAAPVFLLYCCPHLQFGTCAKYDPEIPIGFCWVDQD